VSVMWEQRLKPRMTLRFGRVTGIPGGIVSSQRPPPPLTTHHSPLTPSSLTFALRQYTLSPLDPQSNHIFFFSDQCITASGFSLFLGRLLVAILHHPAG